jgi:hypothetical protein
VKLAEYDFTVEHRSNSKMRHGDALSRCIQVVIGDYSLTKEKIKEAQEKDLCEEYKTCEKYWLNEDHILYYEGQEGCRLIVIPRALVETVLKRYHELPFTAHQGIARTIAAIKRKFWWEF